MTLPTKILITITIVTSTVSTTTTESNESLDSDQVVTIGCSYPFDEVLTPGTVIMSPNYPSPYNNNLDCKITIRFSDSPTVLIEFDPIFWIEGSIVSCKHDYLEVRDGPSANSPVIGLKLCGSTAPAPIQSTGNSMTLIFHTDRSVERVETGFKITANSGMH